MTTADAGPPRRREAALVLGVYLVLAVVWTAPASLSPATTINDPGDPLHLAWTMAWDAHQLARRPWALFDANGFYPHARSLAFSDHLLPQALIAAPVFWATGNAVLAYNLALLAVLTLTAGAMWLLVRKATGSAGAALLAGLVYAFNRFTLDGVLQIHVVSLAGWPLALLFLWRYVTGRRPRDAWGFALAGALQGLAYSYYLIYTILLVPVWYVALRAVAGRRPGASDLRGLLPPLAAAAVIVGLVVWPYLFQVSPDASRGLSVASRREGWAVLSLATVVRGLGYAGTLLALIGAARTVTRPGGHPIGLGAAAIATAVAGIVLSAAPLPQIGQLDLGGRASATVLLAGAVLSGLGATWLLGRLAPAVARASVALIAVAVVLEHRAPARRGEPVPAGAFMPSAYAWLAGQSSEPLVDLPLYPDVNKRRWAAYLYFSTYHWRPIPIGRTSLVPPGHDFLAATLGEFPDAASVAVLDQMGIRTVVVHPLVWPPEERPGRLQALENNTQLRLVRAFTDRPPERFAGWGLGDERVYQVLPGTLRSPCTPSDEVSRDEWTFRGSGATPPKLVRDGDRGTAWVTDGPQVPHDSLRVNLATPERLAAVAIDLPSERFGRGIVLDVKASPDDEWERVPYADGPAERWDALRTLLSDPGRARWVLRFASRTVSSFRLGLDAGGSRAVPAWSIAELNAYRDCR